MPTASVGAPPARDRMVALADVLSRLSVNMSGVMAKPQLEMVGAAWSGGRADHGRRASSWRNRRPGRAREAAISAMMATKLSISIAP